MIHLKKIIFSAIACAFAYGASAQNDDGYVYVTDVLNSMSFTIPSTALNGTCKTSCATYNIRTNTKSDVFIGIDPDANINSKIYVSSSNALLKSFEVEWNVVSTSNASITFYGSHTALTSSSNFSELHNVSTIGKGQSTLLLDDDYRYWGINNTGNASAYFSSITVTWQLAHFRENLTVGYLGTICLPYDVKAEDWADELTPYGIAGKIMNPDNSKAEALVFEEVEEMRAGVAYLFVPKTSDICLKYFGAEASQPSNTNNGLIGSYVNYSFTSDDFKDDDIFLISNNSIMQAGSGSGVGANRAYIKMNYVPVYNESNSSRKLVVSADGYVETGGNPTIVEIIKAIDSLKEGKNHQSAAYDLQGRQIGGAPENGIIVENGKKKLVRVNN